MLDWIGPALVLLSFDSLMVQGRDASPQGPPFREEIVVTADRAKEPRDELAATVSTLTRSEIERLPARTLADVLAVVPGLTIDFAHGNGAKPIVGSRGFFGGGEVEVVRLLVDGVPVGDPESGLVDWLHIPASDIHRVEILRGPGSSLYGDAAIGGVVQVFTRRGSKDGSGELSLESVRDGGYGAEASYRALVRGMDMAIRASSTRSDGWRSHSATNSSRLAVSIRGNDEGWAVHVSADDLDRDDPGPLSLANAALDASRSESLYQFDHEKTEHQRASASLDRRVGALALSTVAYLGQRSTNVLRSLLLAPGFGDSAFRKLRSTTGGASIVADAGWTLMARPAQTRAAIDYDGATIDSDYFAVTEGGAIGPRSAAAGAHRDRLGLYLSEDLHPHPRVRVTAGLRHDSIRDRSGDQTDVRRAWSPRFGISASLGAGTHAHADYSRFFRAAAVDQLFDARGFPDFMGGTFTISNPSLQPERGRSVEAGISRTGSRHRWDVVAYESKVIDEIDFDPATFRYRNIGKSRHRGLEAAASADFHGVHTSLSYDWTRVESLTGQGGGQLKNIPEHVLRASLHGPLPLGAEGTVTYTLKSGRYLDDENLFPLGDENVVDAKLQRRFGRLRVELHLLNIFDRQTNAIGFVLTDFQGTPIPYVYPSERAAMRVIARWTF